LVFDDAAAWGCPMSAEGTTVAVAESAASPSARTMGGFMENPLPWVERVA
jgi:hypothetical protein